MIALILLFSYFGFGLYLLNKLRLKFSVLEKIVISLVVGISAVTTVMALFGQIVGVSSYYILLVTGVIGVSQYKEIFEISKKLMKHIKGNLYIFVALLIFIAIYTSTIIFSYKTSSGGFVFQEVHDSVWHIALIENLQKTIPPLHPSTDSVVLNNYHYFYDLFLASLSKFSYISDFVVYFQVSVVLLATLLISSAYILGRAIHSKFAGVLLAGFTAFAGSFSYFIPYLFHPDQPWHESSFWVSQTLVMIVNPLVIYTLVVTYIFVLLLDRALKSSPKNDGYYKLHVLLIILAATSVGFKSYAWIILSFMYAVFLLVELIRYRSVKTIFVGVTYLIISAPLLWLITKFKGNSFFYEPLWFTNTMIEGQDRVNYLEWKFLQDHYLFKKNWIRLWILEAKKIAVFYFGNLGIRSVFFGLPILLFFKKFRQEKNWRLILIVFFGFLFSSIFPLLYLQVGTVWNSIQFWYYALIFGNILAVIFLAQVLKNQPKIMTTVILFLLFVLAVPTSIKTIADKNKSPTTFGSEKIEFLQTLTTNDLVYICPEETSLYHSSLVKVFTPATVYLANPSQLELVGEDTSMAKQYLDTFLSSEIQKMIDEKKDQQSVTIICTDAHLVGKITEGTTLNKKTIGDWSVFQ